MTDAAGVEGGAQGVGDMLLPHHLSKRCRSILPVQSHGQRLPAYDDKEHPAGTCRQTDTIDHL